ncbi:MAG: ATP-binding protein [Planctomycetota bacterium]
MRELPAPEHTKPRAVRVPDAFEPAFVHAEEYVRRYFEGWRNAPEEGTIEVSGERYILVRAASMSLEFFDLVTSLYASHGEEKARLEARALLFDIAHAAGKADARCFHERMGVTDPIERLSAGPIHFAYTGWAFVDISPESRPSPDEDYLLLYDHPRSFEADSWLQAGREADFPVCIMNAGYSSGWCAESFGVELTAVEVECRAMGAERCRFLMAPPSRIREHLARHHCSSPAGRTKVAIPEFFERKRVKQELRYREQLLHATLEATADGILVSDTRGGALLWNTLFLRMWRIPDEVMATRDEDKMLQCALRQVADPESFLADVQRLYESCQEAFDVLDFKDGRVFERYSCPVVHDSKVLGRAWSFRDVTAQRRAEHALSLAARRWRSTFDALQDAVAVIDRDHRIVEANRAMADLFPDEAVVGARCYELFHGTDAPPEGCPGCRVFATGEAANHNVHEPHLGGRHFNVCAYPIPEEGGPIRQMVHLVRDITEQKDLEERLGRAQKLQAIGQLAAGVAHEINSPTQYVTDNTRFVRDSLATVVEALDTLGDLLAAAADGPIPDGLLAKAQALAEEADVEYLTTEVPAAMDDALEGLRRIAEIIAAMKRFAHPGKGEPTPTDINELVANAVTITRNEWKYVAEVVTDLDPALPAVSCVAADISQVMVNLLVNAAHAIAEARRHDPGRQGRIGVMTCAAGEAVEVRVTDTGTGIAEEAAQRIFDPFFTTKEPGVGTGQGLALAHAIVVDKHGGDIAFETTPGLGTVFYVSLPLAGAPATRGDPDA